MDPKFNLWFNYVINKNWYSFQVQDINLYLLAVEVYNIYNSDVLVIIQLSNKIVPNSFSSNFLNYIVLIYYMSHVDYQILNLLQT